MSDPRNVAHAKKVTQEKKHQGTEASADDGPTVQPGKKAAAAKMKSGPAISDSADSKTAGAVDTPPATPSAVVESALVVLAQLKDLEFHSRANLERLAELTLTVDTELKQKDMVGLLDEVYSAQNLVQTKLTALIDGYKDECDRMQGESA